MYLALTYFGEKETANSTTNACYKSTDNNLDLLVPKRDKGIVRIADDLGANLYDIKLLRPQSCDPNTNSISNGQIVGLINHSLLFFDYDLQTPDPEVPVINLTHDWVLPIDDTNPTDNPTTTTIAKMAIPSTHDRVFFLMLDYVPADENQEAHRIAWVYEVTTPTANTLPQLIRKANLNELLFKNKKIELEPTSIQIVGGQKCETCPELQGTETSPELMVFNDAYNNSFLTLSLTDWENQVPLLQGEESRTGKSLPPVEPIILDANGAAYDPN